MMVSDGVDVKHEVVKCGMRIVEEMNVLRKENKLLANEVKEWKLKTVNKEKEQIEVKRQEEASWATVARKLKSHVIERLVIWESRIIGKKIEDG